MARSNTQIRFLRRFVIVQMVFVLDLVKKMEVCVYVFMEVCIGCFCWEEEGVARCRLRKIGNDSKFYEGWEGVRTWFKKGMEKGLNQMRPWQHWQAPTKLTTCPLTLGTLYFSFLKTPDTHHTSLDTCDACQTLFDLFIQVCLLDEKGSSSTLHYDWSYSFIHWLKTKIWLKT